MHKKLTLTLFFLSFFSIFFMSLLPLSYNAIAESFLIDFDDGILLSQYSTTGLTTFNLTDGACINNQVVRSGTRSYWLNNGLSRALFNISRNNIINISFWNDRNTPSDNQNFFMYFNNSNGETVIKFLHTNDGTGQMKLVYYDHMGAGNQVGTGAENGEAHRIGFEITAVDSVLYNYWTADGNDYEIGTPFNVQDSADNCSITQIYFYNDHDDSEINIDDLTLVEGTLTDPEQNIIEECVGSEIGTLIQGTSISQWYGDVSNCPYMLTVYENYVSGTINSLGIAIHSDMATQSGINALALKINEEWHGSVDTIEAIDNERYIAYWNNLDHDISNQPLYIMFYSPQTYAPQWKIYKSSMDINGDGSAYFFYINDGGYWNSYDYQTIPESAYNGYRSGSEPNIRLCINLAETTLVDIENSIIVLPSTVQAYESALILAMVNTSVMSSGASKLISIERMGIYDNYSFVSQFKPMFYTPIQTGTYNISLIVNGVSVDSVVLTCSGELSNYLYTVPNPSDVDETFNIRYKTTSALKGRIDIYNDKERLVESWGIDANSEGNITYSIDESGVYLIELYSYDNTSSYLIYSYPHYVGEGKAPYISIYPETLYFEETSEGRIVSKATITGQHGLVGCDVYVKDDYTKIRSVGDYVGVFSFEYKPQIEGRHNITLCLMHEGSELVLATAQYYLIGGVVDEPEYESPMLPDLDPKIGAIVGTILTSVFTLLPAILCLSFGKKPDAVPPLSYALCGGIGISFCTVLNLFPLWVPFFFIVIAIILTVGLYIKDKG